MNSPLFTSSKSVVFANLPASSTVRLGPSFNPDALWPRESQASRMYKPPLPHSQRREDFVLPFHSRRTYTYTFLTQRARTSVCLSLTRAYSFRDPMSNHAISSAKTTCLIQPLSYLELGVSSLPSVAVVQTKKNGRSNHPSTLVLS